MGGNSPWTPDLALIWVEVIFPLGLAKGDAADPTAIMPGGSVVIAEEAEDPIPLQCPMATYNEPTLPWLPLFLWERELSVTGRGSEAGRGTHHLLGEDTYGLCQFCSCLLRVPDRAHRQLQPDLRISLAE